MAEVRAGSTFVSINTRRNRHIVHKAATKTGACIPVDEIVARDARSDANNTRIRDALVDVSAHEASTAEACRAFARKAADRVCTRGICVTVVRTDRALQNIRAIDAVAFKSSIARTGKTG